MFVLKPPASFQLAQAGEIVQTRYPRWDLADDSVSGGSTSMEELPGVPWQFGGISPWRVHTEFVVDGEQVHIDICGATPDGTGGAWNETRVHVNGELRGLAASYRCSPVAAEREEEPALAVVGQHIVEVHRPSSIREAAQCGGVRVDVRHLLR